jgi:glycerophosphoryl diester phosphodiesterase
VQIFGHRGSPGFPRYGENTLTGFRRAIRAGADGIEFDVRRCGDGQIVVIHDSTIDRTTNGSGTVAILTYEELRQFHAGHGDSIPLLTTVLNTFRDLQCILNIELKESGLAEEVAFMIGREMKNRIVMSTFDNEDSGARASSTWQELDAIGKTVSIAPLITREKLQGMGTDAFIARARAMNASAIHPPRDAATADLIRSAHDAGLAVRIWTVNVPEDVVMWSNLGADAVISDFPGRAIEALRNSDAHL